MTVPVDTMDFSSLVDDIILDIFNYLEPKDRLSLALCGHEWFHLYRQHIQHKRKFILPRCHLLTATVVSNLIKDLQLQHIQQFDVTGCNCFPTSWLVKLMHMMPDLRALLVSDTNLSVNHVLNSLPHCRNITTLAFSFSEKSCSKFNSLNDLLRLLWKNKEQSKALQTCFSRIECLKITSTSTVMSFLAVVARILSWCINCQEIHLEWQFVRQEAYLESDDLKMKCFGWAQKTITSLPCVTKLRSLTFLIRNTSIPRYTILVNFLNRLFDTRQLKLQRLCVAWPCSLQYFGASIFSPSQPSLFIERNTAQPLPLNNFSSLTHIGAFKISSLNSGADLRSCSVTCNNTWEWFELCRQHQNLKKQCIYLKEPSSYQISKRRCQVPQLEILDIVVDDKEYSSPFKQKMAADLITSCPNVQQLTIREWNRPRRLCEDVLAQIIQLEKLKILRACLNGIESIERVVNGCQQLECLHLWVTLCGTRSIIDFNEGIGALKLPENVRELALEWDCFDGPKPNYPSQPSADHQLSHRFMLSAAEGWTALNVLILKSSCADDDVHKLPETIVYLVSRLTSLSHLALIGDFPADVVRMVKLTVRRKIQSIRPSFRLYIGPQLYHMYYPYE